MVWCWFGGLAECAEDATVCFFQLTIHLLFKVVDSLYPCDFFFNLCVYHQVCFGV